MLILVLIFALDVESENITSVKLYIIQKFLLDVTPKPSLIIEATKIVPKCSHTQRRISRKKKTPTTLLH